MQVGLLLGVPELQVIGGVHGVGGESKVAELAGALVLALVEDKAVLVVHIHGIIGVGENLLALVVQAGDGVAVDDEGFYTAQEIAVKGHGVGVRGILFCSLGAVNFCGAHAQQHIGGGLGVLLPNQRGNDGGPEAPILGLGHLGEQLHIGAADAGQIVSGLGCLSGGLGGCFDSGGLRSGLGNGGFRGSGHGGLALGAAHQGQQEQGAEKECGQFLFHNVPPYLLVSID